MLQKRNLVSNIPMHYSTATVYFLNLRSTKKISVFSITKNRRFSNLDSNFPLNGTTPFVAKGFGDVATEDGCDVQMLGVQSSLPENVKNGNVEKSNEQPLQGWLYMYRRDDVITLISKEKLGICRRDDVMLVDFHKKNGGDVPSFWRNLLRF